jgi:hypothetical protein
VKHPEKGEALAAAETLNARMEASVQFEAGESFDIGMILVDRRTGETGNNPEFSVHAIYGDLFDVGEMLATSAGVTEMFIADIATGRRDVMSAMLSLYLMAAGHGVLLERARWEK